MFTAGGIDGIRARRYSLPIHRHLVACANTELVLFRDDRVRSAVSWPGTNFHLETQIASSAMRNRAENSPYFINATSKDKELSAEQAELMEAL
jgi:hypothetical protein